MYVPLRVDIILLFFKSFFVNSLPLRVRKASCPILYGPSMFLKENFGFS